MDSENDTEEPVPSPTNGKRRTSQQSTGEFDYDELPIALIATNVGETIFTDEEQKATFEEICSVFGHNVTFNYLPSFRRIRVNYSSPEEAVTARIGLHSKEICGSVIKFYFAQNITVSKDASATLLPPKPEKQFLISPPSSPPVGWEPAPEAEPIIDYDLLSALANLAPGEKHELHPADEGKPSIVVEPCNDPAGKDKSSGQKIPQTKRPDVPCSS